MDAYEAFVRRLEGAEGAGRQHRAAGGQRLTTRGSGGAAASAAGDSGFAAAQAELGVREEGVEAMTTLIMLQLRTTRGLLPAELTPRFGATLAAAAEGACRDAAAELPAEWWVMEAEEEASSGGDSGVEAALRCRRFALRDPEGLLFSNDAISTVFARLDERLERDDVGGGGLGGGG
mmetsp:Transcript_45647/g.142823  ORF Transcript_45647/g.142823 Transcript_45647/m.142823 type:complete len:177 (-) Transcript_45647:78-608(-)